MCALTPLQPRPPITLADEERHCNTLLKFWETVAVAIVTDTTCDKYRDWRKQRVSARATAKPDDYKCIWFPVTFLPHSH